MSNVWICSRCDQQYDYAVCSSCIVCHNSFLMTPETKLAVAHELAWNGASVVKWSFNAEGVLMCEVVKSETTK